jgi:release factor glutamine methyltransferase
MPPSNLLLEVLTDAVNALKRSGSPSPHLDAEVLLCHQLSMSRTDLYTRFHQMLSDDQADGFRRLIKRRMKAEPVAYIRGFKEFWSLPFEVSPAVLIPRPDTEILVQEVLNVSRGFGQQRPDLLEIGTGSGVVSIALAVELANVRIVATDVSCAALEIAKKNAEVHSVADRISFREGDLFEAISEKFDTIASNPPYISEAVFAQLPPGVRDYEPREALVAGPKGTEFHEALIRDGKQYLKEGGRLLMEIGDGQKDAISAIFETDGCYEDIRFSADYSGLLRVAIARRKV